MNDKSAEQQVLGAILTDNTAIEEINLTKDDFSGVAEKITYGVMREMYESGMTIDIVSLVHKLKEERKLDDVGGMQYVMYLSEINFTAKNVKIHANIVKEISVRRHFKAMLDEYKFRADDYEDINMLIEEAQQKILSISETADVQNASSAKEAAERYAEVAKQRRQSGSYGVKTGFKDLDYKTDGFKKGALIVIAARPSMGKTAFAMNIAQNVAKRGVTLFFSLEMREEELMQRVFNSEAFSHGVNLSDGNYNEKIDAVTKIVSNMRLNIYDNARVTLTDIRRVARQVRHREGQLDLIVIDYLQLMSIQGKHDSRVQEVSELTRTLKIMARELDVPIIILSQLNRGVETRNDKRPMLSDLRESGSIEQDADIVMMLYRDEFYNPETTTPNVAELIVNKNRGGSTGKINLFFNGNSTSFKDLSREDAPRFLNREEEKRPRRQYDD